MEIIAEVNDGKKKRKRSERSGLSSAVRPR